ncbi:hypothetical protein [Kribbella sp. VKM Ac-2566]|uniref:hypothetical protein n=1 Tax=Kribbella sp. VKM Ac-2566 TaxID=2512218 RepID=UPI00106258D6|nr:hypothetical protein [Kribbella sp. VKM Ac-2566]TDX03713.1 hypothetical protein EV647_1958 [Kribbella sp. VKM Ac-2566]
MATTEVNPARRPGFDHGGGAEPAVQRTLFCYAHERLTRTLRDLAELQEAAYAEAIERGYQLGPLFVEEDSSGQAMQTLIDAVLLEIGGAAVALPHRGHLIPLGGPREWQQLLEELTGHPIVFISRIP